MACGRHTVLVTPIQPAEGGGWVVAGHLPPDGASLEPSAFPEIRHRDRLLLCWECVVSGDADARIAEAVEDGPLACAVCGQDAARERGLCGRHWAQAPGGARQALTYLAHQLVMARRRYLDCQGDWSAVTGLARRHAELVATVAPAAAANVEAEEARHKEVRGKRVLLEAGTPVRALETRRIRVKAGQPQVIEEGMRGTVAYTVTYQAGSGKKIAIDWEFPTKRRRQYATPIEAFEVLSPEEAAAPPAGTAAREGRGWTYEEAVADALAGLGAGQGEVDVVILREDAGRTVVRVTHAVPPKA